MNKALLYPVFQYITWTGHVPTISCPQVCLVSPLDTDCQMKKQNEVVELGNEISRNIGERIRSPGKTQSVHSFQLIYFIKMDWNLLLVRFFIY